MLLRNRPVAITGHLTRAPRLERAAHGACVCELRVAVESVADDSGLAASHGYCGCVEVSVHGPDGKRAAEVLEAGSIVTIRGHAEQGASPAAGGSEPSTIRIVADDVRSTLARPGRHARARGAAAVADVVGWRAQAGETLTTFTQLADIPIDR